MPAEFSLSVSMLLFGLVAFLVVLLWAQVWRFRFQKMLKSLEIAEQERVQVYEQQRLLNAELAELRERVQKGEWIDALTGLHSRQIFEDRLALTVGQSIRYKLTCAVMFLNLDHFRIVNDALGLQAGDFILKKVAERLGECIRDLDTVSRFAGDEFVLLFPQINRAETAGYIARRLLERLSQPYDVEGENVWLTASIGIAVFPADGAEGSVLLRNAEDALHQAKSHGRNTYQFYRKEMHVLGRRELILGAALHSDLLFHDLSLSYQPALDIRTRRIIGMDALLEWQHPDFGSVPFKEFVHLAENNGRIMDIGEWIVRQAVQNVLEWREQGLPMMAVSLPLSLKQLEKMHFVQFLSKMLQEYPLEPDIFIFEITDTAGLFRIEAIKKMLEMMKHLGVRISINGLGTDNLSIRRLNQLPIDVFKIDQSLTQEISADQESQAIAKMIIALASSLNALVVAEGVETANQEAILCDLGCFVMQGRFFSPPLQGHLFTKAAALDICEGHRQPVS